MLLDSRRPVTLEEIHDSVQGYGQEDMSAFKRMFERDKKELRELGIPIELQPTDPFGEEMGYRIPKEAYYLPEISFDHDERLALWILHKLVREGGFPFGEEVRGAMYKLAPDLGGEGMDTKVPLGWLDAEGGGAAENLALLLRAVIGQKRVKMLYRSLHDREPQEREVDPYGLYFKQGCWYLVGHCHLRGGLRSFRVSRIHGEAEMTQAAKKGPDFRRPTDFKVEDYAKRAPWEFEEGPEFVALIRFSPKLAWWIRESMAHLYPFKGEKDGGGLLEVKARNRDTLLSWVLSFGEDAEVVSPTELRKAMRERLLKMRAALSARKG
jgi:predicted DNA-binding transcriptional regulator YafY